MEDITWIVNHSSSWQQDGATASSRVDDDGVFIDAGRTLEQSMEDEQVSYLDLQRAINVCVDSSL